MPHIKLQEGVPGMRALQIYRPETAEPLNQLVNILLRGPSTLSRGERELIATFVSSRNDCFYCQTMHGAVAAYHFGGNENLVAQTKLDAEKAPLTEKLKALLDIANNVRQGGKHVTVEVVDKARKAGATDLEIHDTVLIAAAFCMYNRYVDGLATWAPDDPEFYRERGERLAKQGYFSFARRFTALSQFIISAVTRILSHRPSWMPKRRH
ncbi:MAG: carboxymuconolactone decarboxylase [Verrucomicrobia bacterium]|nr:MAG: carboxymuconolactone decarboxylase [Verrucomicrobiota bacterium]PYL70637.1 MAG: carboxymuconolactone decarboxylase [Verrucomicrobiota bacterium]